ncbi:MAG: PH domain-containing protein [Phycisphaerales bacterium]
MIRYTCANCRRELEVEDALAGQRVKCPHCGNVEVIASTARAAPADRTAPAAPAPHDRAAAMGLPPDSGPEVEVRRVHPVLFRSRPAGTAGVAALLLGGLTLAVIAYSSSAFAGMRWTAYLGLLSCMVGLCWVAWWKLDSISTLVVISNKRTTVRMGLLSRRTSELLHDQVKDIRVEQTFGQRLLRTGTLGLDGSGTDAIELSVEHLPDPVGLRNIIDAYRNIG